MRTTRLLRSRDTDDGGTAAAPALRPLPGREAFEAFVHSRSVPTMHAALLFLGDARAAEATLLRLFSIAYRSWPRWERDGSADAELCRNLVTQLRRSSAGYRWQNWRRGPSGRSRLHHRTPPAVAALRAYPAPQRLALVLTGCFELTPEALAFYIGCSPRTVREAAAVQEQLAPHVRSDLRYGAFVGPGPGRADHVPSLGERVQRPVACSIGPWLHCAVLTGAARGRQLRRALVYSAAGLIGFTAGVIVPAALS